ncbi:MAG TPA: hypothetical protein VK735_09450 [Pseudonocardia sp.]|uniref:hypothetical protein n=1 Tax=Pseudonocardia sp. TaxID=60912 RepID=UPI002CBD4C01|nr:hypothetical protein [Pseudonocardia sp.]HTF47660.1 hypothetical protein [Pseudonocardia sp.]
MDDGGAGAGAVRRGLASHRRGSPVTRPADAGRRADKDAVAGRRDFDGVGEPRVHTQRPEPPAAV